MNNKYLKHFIQGLTTNQRNFIVRHSVIFTSTHDWNSFVDMGIYTRAKHDDDRWIFHATELGYAIHHYLRWQSR